MTENGILHEASGRIIELSLKCVIGDGQGRSYMRHVKSSGYYSCERCYVRCVCVGSKVVYPGVGHRKRTDVSFRCRHQWQHHLPWGRSAFESLEFDMVNGFHLDSMHLVYGGVMQRLLCGWMLQGKIS